MFQPQIIKAIFLTNISTAVCLNKKATLRILTKNLVRSPEQKYFHMGLLLTSLSFFLKGNEYQFCSLVTLVLELLK